MRMKDSFDRMYRSVTIMEARSTGSIEGLSLTYRDKLYLDYIALTEGCTVSSMSETLGVSMPAATKRVNSLEERGLVTRTRQEGDGRYKIVALTDRGNEIMMDEERAVRDVLESLESSFSGEEVDTFCRMMDRMSELFEESMDQGTSRKR